MSDRVYKPIRNSKGAGGLCGPGPGRPKGSGKKQFLDYANDALETVVHLMKHGRSEKIKLTAATYLLDQGFGKAQQSMEISATEFIRTFGERWKDQLPPEVIEQLVALEDEIGAELH